MGNDFFYALTPWELSPVVIICTLAAAACYLRGCRILPQLLRHRILFWTGLAALYAVLHTQFDYYAEHAFFMHRLQHSILHHFAPFLIALSRPGAALFAGMPVRMQAGFRLLSDAPPVRRLVDFLNHPVVAVALFCMLVAVWLVPSIHFIVMLDGRWYRVMNWSMVVDGLMFWNLVFNNFALCKAALSVAQRIIIMLAVIPPQIAVGLVLFLAPRELYPVYSICGRAMEGLTPLADQQLGGLIVWNGVMMSVIGLVIVIRREWMKQRSRV